MLERRWRKTDERMNAAPENRYSLKANDFSIEFGLLKWDKKNV